MKTRHSMASIHFRQQHKRKIYWTYTENFLRVRLLLAMVYKVTWHETILYCDHNLLVHVYILADYRAHIYDVLHVTLLCTQCFYPAVNTLVIMYSCCPTPSGPPLLSLLYSHDSCLQTRLRACSAGNVYHHPAAAAPSLTHSLTHSHPHSHHCSLSSEMTKWRYLLVQSALVLERRRKSDSDSTATPVHKKM